MTRRDILNHLLRSFAILPSISAASSSSEPTPHAPNTFAVAVEHSIPEWLRLWQEDEMLPITHPDCEIEKQLLHAAIHSQKLNINYNGGSNPGSTRSISPILLFAKSHYPAHYLLAWCHQRQQARIFRTDAITLLSYVPSL